MAQTTYQMPIIGGSNAEMGVLVSKKVLPMMFADLAYHKGYMVDERYTAEGRQSLEVLIPKISRPTGKFNNIREDGYDVFDNTRDQIGQKFDKLSIEWEYNEQIDIAEAELAQNITGEQIPGILASRVSSIVTEEMNKITGAAIYKSSLEYNGAKDVSERKIAYFDPSVESMPDMFAELNAKIGNADPLFGDTSFNNRKISGVVSNTAYAIAMRTKNQIILASSKGQEILLEGKFGKVTLADVKAYKGTVQGTHIFVLPDNFFPSYNNSISFGNYMSESDYPNKGKVYGIFGVSEATYRAFIDGGVKMVDTINFRGWAMQPFYRVGVACLKPWGTAMLVSNDFEHEETKIKSTALVATVDGSDVQGDNPYELTVPVSTTTTALDFTLDQEVELVGTTEVVQAYITDAWVEYGEIAISGKTLTVTPSGTNGEAGVTPLVKALRLPANSIKSIFTGVSNTEETFTINVVAA
jgi:hypothetical protein